MAAESSFHLSQRNHCIAKQKNPSNYKIHWKLWRPFQAGGEALCRLSTAAADFFLRWRNYACCLCGTGVPCSVLWIKDSDMSFQVRKTVSVTCEIRALLFLFLPRDNSPDSVGCLMLQKDSYLPWGLSHVLPNRESEKLFSFHQTS